MKKKQHDGINCLLAELVLLLATRVQLSLFSEARIRIRRQVISE